MTDFASWTRNVADHFKDQTLEEIRKTLSETSNPFAILMENWKGDFNLATVIRTANGFNAEAVFYYGKKKFDRRGTVGTHHYVNLNHLDDLNKLLLLKEDYCFIGIDNNTETECENLLEIDWTSKLYKISNTSIQYNLQGSKIKKPLFIFGEEGEGITKELLDLCDSVIYIPMDGSVRSFNAATASGIIMWDYVKYCKKMGKRIHELDLHWLDSIFAF